VLEEKGVEGERKEAQNFPNLYYLATLSGEQKYQNKLKHGGRGAFEGVFNHLIDEVHYEVSH